jgi:hypothetical protein
VTDTNGQAIRVRARTRGTLAAVEPGGRRLSDRVRG